MGHRSADLRTRESPVRWHARATQPVRGDTLPSMPSTRAGPYGHQHLAGNAWEWVSDAYHPKVYTDAERTGPAGPADGPWRGLAGEAGAHLPRTCVSQIVSGPGHGLAHRGPLRPSDRHGATRPGPSTGTGPDRRLRSLLAAPSRGGPCTSPPSTLRTSTRHRDADARAFPAAERRLTPDGSSRQPFRLEVPAGGTYVVSAALDGVAGSRGHRRGIGQRRDGPGRAESDQADEDVDGIEIRLQAPPAGVLPAARARKAPVALVLGGCPAMARPTGDSRIALRLGVWLVVAILLTFPCSHTSTTALIGDPRVDVWNHAWATTGSRDTSATGRCPFHTRGSAVPTAERCGSSTFRCPARAAGNVERWAALGYNAVLIARIAWAGIRRPATC